MTWTISQMPSYLPFLIPLAWFAAAIAPLLPVPARSRWPIARVLAATAMILAASLLVMALQHPVREGIIAGTGILAFRADPLSACVALMTAIVGWSILRFSQHYLDGDPGRLHFAAWFNLTLTSVSVFVLTNHLAVLALAWLATSLSLHRLLVFYPERPKALLAAHKKFLVSRLADLLLVVAFVLLAQSAGSGEISVIAQRLAAGSVQASLPLEAAAGLIVMAAALKSAQLPFHGWLLQVMEAPTPVSALLHAGVVNMGGYLLLRLSPLIEVTHFASWLLLTFALITVAVASLVMMTRISIKVMLAWSTTAQMGFMLLECALGLYHLALAHLIAHSFYKAHTFLSSGQAPLYSLIRRAANEPTGHGVRNWSFALVAGAVAVALAQYVSGKPLTATTAVTGVVIVSVVAVLLVEMGGSLGRSGWLKGFAASLAITGAYLLVERLLTGVTLPSSTPIASPAMIIAGITLLLLLAARAHIMLRPEAAPWRRARPLLYNGLYLDEAFTRVTFRLWPPKPRFRKEQPEPAPIYRDQGVSS